MKWSWGWKGAAVAGVLWVAYALAMLGLGQFSDFRVGRVFRVQSTWTDVIVDPLLHATAVCHHALARPGEVLVNAVWLHAGRRVYPRVPEGVAAERLPFVLRGEEGRWVLCPAVRFLAPTDVAVLGARPCYALVRPEPKTFAVHIVLLPGVVIAVLGALLGLVLALIRYLVPGSRRTEQP